MFKGFWCFVEQDDLRWDCHHFSRVVVDGQSTFDMYQDHGCEDHLYANYLWDQLVRFKETGVKCYFLFHCGNEDMEAISQRDGESNSINSIFAKNIYKEVLDEMGFEYVTCESKWDIVALAQRLCCPIISNDVEFCFTGLQYIPQKDNSIAPSEGNDVIMCFSFSLLNFLRRYALTEAAFAMFVVLTGENMFPETIFSDLFSHIGLYRGLSRNYSSFRRLLKCLSRPYNRIRDRNYYDYDYDYRYRYGGYSKQELLQFIPSQYKQMVSKELDKVLQIIKRKEVGGVGTAMLLGEPAAPAPRAWFAEGVAAGRVAAALASLHRTKRLFASCTPTTAPRPYQDQPILFSLHILKYAYDLLTDYRNEGFTFVFDPNSERKTMTVAESHSVRKPDYEAHECVFENGWSELRELGLFEHFLKETVRLVDLRALDGLPGDSRLLVVASVYFSRKKNEDTSAEVACVLLSYVTLSVVLEARATNNRYNLSMLPFAPLPVNDSTTDEYAVTDADCDTAVAILDDFVETTRIDHDDHKLDREIIYPLEEFQHCLVQMNALNALCGAPFAPTAFSRTYSGCLVAKLRCAIRSAGDAKRFLSALLSPAPSVLALLNSLIEAYEEMVLVSMFNDNILFR